MLILSRKETEEIVIGGSIRIVVVEIRDNKVRLGIEAPPDVMVNRREIQDLVDANAANPRKRRD